MFTRIPSAAVFGRLIRLTRKEKRLTQKQLATACKTGVRFISDLENGKASCRIGLALAVALSLGIKVGTETE